MKDNVFIDTNILVYFATDKTEKRDIILTKLAECEYSYISIQVLNEFNNSCFKKSLLKPDEIEFALNEYTKMFNVVILNIATIIDALRLKQKYGYSYYDSLIISTALQNDCKILYSEDMQHTQKIDDKLTILNPFK
jgi:predicted nucleic acid-binding protein